MAALCPGVQYGLSSQQNFGENKDLIFVKLTDSALRAIEEYIKNQNKFSCQSPTIKFLGNENGELSFPSVHHEGNCTSFSFSMSSTADMEGPAGSFECIQQIGPPPRGSLECLGSIPYKIRIHANDDVYEVTRNRMTEAEDKYKNKCTREIKPNQTDIGRKVKVKQSSRTSVQPLIRREQQQQLQQQQQQQPSSQLTMRDSLLKPSYQSNVPPSKQVHSTSSNNNNNNNNNNGLSTNGLGSNLVSSSRPQLHNKPSVPDIARRPLKERLIHLLALKPFKKVELYERLNKEGGLRERNGMSSVLKQISQMKDNCYHLNRAMWNDVHEDWPFYTESEKQMLKRRKPANLTPPGSSDGGSSGSGQSPTSTHPGSPPQITTSSKRPGFYDGVDGIPTKRQRVSHYKRPPQQQQQQINQTTSSSSSSSTTNNDQMYRSSIENNNSQRRPVTDSRDASNMNPRSRESPTNGYFNNNNNSSSSPMNGYGMLNNNININDKRNLNNLSDDDDDNRINNANNIIINNNKKRSNCDSHNNSLSIGVQKTFNNSSNRSSSSPSSAKYYQQQQQQQSAPPPQPPTTDDGGGRNGYYNNGRKEQHLNDECREINTINRSKYNKVTSSTQNSNNRIARVSPDSQTDNLPSVEVDTMHEEPSKSVKPDSNNDFPDYLTQYVTIKTPEQRRRYKADFNADYAEYRDLHGVVEKVSRRFAQLEERLKKENEASPKYKDLMKQIVKEYTENKNDLAHQKAKQRFQYLHDKLSHIKRLVLEYDQNLPDSQY